MLNSFIVLAGAASWLLNIYAWAHIAAFILSWIQADLRNPLVSFINSITVPAWRSLGRRLPPALASWSPYLVLMLIIFAERTIPGLIRSLGALFSGELPLAAGLQNIMFYILFGGFYILSNVVGFVAILSVVYFAFSMLGSPLNNPLVHSITFLLEPLLVPLRRFLPRAKVDLSPLALAAAAFLLKVGIENLGRYIEGGIII